MKWARSRVDFLIGGWVGVEFTQDRADSRGDSSYRHGGSEPCIACVVVVFIRSHLSRVTIQLCFSGILGMGGSRRGESKGFIMEVLQVTLAKELHAFADKAAWAAVHTLGLGEEEKRVQDGK